MCINLISDKIIDFFNIKIENHFQFCTKGLILLVLYRIKEETIRRNH